MYENKRRKLYDSIKVMIKQDRYGWNKYVSSDNNIVFSHQDICEYDEFDMSGDYVESYRNLIREITFLPKIKCNNYCKNCIRHYERTGIDINLDFKECYDDNPEGFLSLFTKKEVYKEVKYFCKKIHNIVDKQQIGEEKLFDYIVFKRDTKLCKELFLNSFKKALIKDSSVKILERAIDKLVCNLGLPVTLDNDNKAIWDDFLYRAYLLYNYIKWCENECEDLPFNSYKRDVLAIFYDTINSKSKDNNYLEEMKNEASTVYVQKICKKKVMYIIYDDVIDFALDHIEYNKGNDIYCSDDDILEEYIDKRIRSMGTQKVKDNLIKLSYDELVKKMKRDFLHY